MRPTGPTVPFAGAIRLWIDPNGQNWVRGLYLVPTFPSNLQYADTIEFSNQYGTEHVGLDLPGLRTLRQISSSLTIFQLALADMTSFSGLQCPPTSIAITGNPLLTSLKGLEGMSASATLQSLQISGNPLLKPAGANAPLTSVLGCFGTSGISATVDVEVDGCPRPIDSTEALCVYATSPAGTACLPSPPSPPPSPPPAPPPRPPPPVSCPIAAPQPAPGKIDHYTSLWTITSAPPIRPKRRHNTLQAHRYYIVAAT